VGGVTGWPGTACAKQWHPMPNPDKKWRLI
jgi:hypothetical protein